MGDAQAVVARPSECAAPRDMRTFTIIWLGQLISLIGSGLTGFALGVWIFETTGRATPFALTALFGSLPGVLLSPLAGVLADRWNRRWIMILADTGAALATLLAAVMILADRLQIWQIYVVALLGAVCGTFQRPAYMASVTMLVPKKDLGRASGLMQGSQAVGMLVPPVLAGFLFVTIGLRGIILIDFVTYFFAIGALLLVRIPQPEASQAGAQGRGSIWRESAYGWTYIKARSGLLSMLIYFALVNFLLNATGVLMAPLVLSFGEASVYGLVQAVFGIGMLVGSTAMSAWGGPERKMLGIYGFIAAMAVGLVITGLRPSAWTVALGVFTTLASVPIASGCSQVIWQSKVPPDVQGRVFAIRGMIATSMMPLAYILSGLLADGVFEPLMDGGATLAVTVGQVIGVGPGRGIGLMYVLGGLLLLLVTAAAYAYPRMRLLEDELPDAIPAAPDV